MSASLKIWQQVQSRVRHRIASHRKRHARFYKLQGASAKTAVIEGVVARLLAVDAVLPNALRKRLAPRPLVVKGAPAGWLGSWRPVSSTLWAAWRVVHRSYIERGCFWFEESAAHDNLIDLAVDAERGSYCAATADSGQSDLETLSRFTDAGQIYATEPTRQLERDASVDKFVTELEQRTQDAEEEFARLVPALNEYARKLRCSKQRRAFGLICNGLQSTGAAVAVQCRVSEATVSKLRAAFDLIAERFFALHTPPEEAAPADLAPSAEVPHDETLSQIVEALHSDAALDLAATFRAPDVDADLSESILHHYARNRSSAAHMRDNWSGGRRRYSDAELVTGSRYGGRYDDPAKIAEHDARKQHANKFSDLEMRELRQKAADADFAINGFLRAIDSFLAARAAESVDALLGASISGRKT